VGNALGNFAALAFIVVAGVVSAFSFRSGALTLLVSVYGLLAFAWLGDRRSRPSLAELQLSFLSPSEASAYRRYHIHLRFPAAGQALSALLNLLRVAGIGWGLAALWKGHYVIGGLLIGYFFVVGNACLRFDPIRYMLPAAEKGNPVARQQLFLIETVRDWRSSLIDRGVSSQE